MNEEHSDDAVDRGGLAWSPPGGPGQVMSRPKWPGQSHQLDIDAGTGDLLEQPRIGSCVGYQDIDPS